MTETMTMEARLLEELKVRWLTPLEALGACGCLSLSQRAGSFARRGHTVLKQRVKLSNGKTVMSYHIPASFSPAQTA